MKKIISLYLTCILIVLCCCTVFATELSNFSYSGESYNATNKYGVNLRDEKGTLIQYIQPNSSLYVHGIYNTNSARAVVTWNGKTGTVLVGGLKKVSIPVQASFNGENYYATNNSALNFRDVNGNIINCIPINSLVYVKGVSETDSTRAIVEWNGIEGSVLARCLNKVQDGIFVSIDNQTVKMIKAGQMICQGSCVTGLKGVYNTPKGVYNIKYKQTNTYLTDGRTYNVSVSYWMPFYRGYGFHDASWRSAFGGDYYKNNGSHGCVNLPIELARQIYENAYNGMSVYVS